MANRNIRIVLAYDGTDYCGWQSQSAGRTVQDTFERALEAVHGHRARGHRQTDLGRHARHRCRTLRGVRTAPEVASAPWSGAAAESAAAAER